MGEFSALVNEEELLSRIVCIDSTCDAASMRRGAGRMVAALSAISDTITAHRPLCNRGFLAIVASMPEGRRPTFRNYRPRAEAAKPSFPEMPFPPGLSVTPKQIGFLHYHLGLGLAEIAGRYEGLSVALVHLGLYHYLVNERAIKAELSDEATFNRGDSLKELSMTLPGVGLDSLIETMTTEPMPAESGRVVRRIA